MYYTPFVNGCIVLLSKKMKFVYLLRKGHNITVAFGDKYGRILISGLLEAKFFDILRIAKCVPRQSATENTRERRCKVNEQLLNQIKQGVVVSQNHTITYINPEGAKRYPMLRVGGILPLHTPDKPILLGAKKCYLKTTQCDQIDYTTIEEVATQGLSTEQIWGLFGQLRQGIATLSAQSAHLASQGAQMDTVDKTIAQLCRLVQNSEEIHEGISKPPTKLLDIAGLLRELCAEVNTLFVDLGIALECTTNPMSVLIKGDTMWLRRLLLQLISNSAKNSKKILIKLESDHSNVRLTVSDMGKIEGSLHNALHGERLIPKQNEGARLGIAVASQIVTAHGGSILASQSQNDGLVITISLPCAQKSTEALSTPVVEPLLQVDKSGGRSDLLLELSDILPKQFYHREP